MATRASRIGNNPSATSDTAPETAQIASGKRSGRMTTQAVDSAAMVQIANADAANGMENVTSTLSGLLAGEGWRATTDDDEHYVYAIALP